MLHPVLAIAAMALASSTGAPPQAAPESDNGSSTDCRIRVNAAPSAWIIQGYDPFGNSLPEGVFGASFTNDGEGQCSFAAVFRVEQPPFGLAQPTGRPIPYTLLSLMDSQDVTPRTGLSQKRPEQRDITLAAHENRTLLFRLAVAADGVTQAGTFSQEVTLEADDKQMVSVGGTRLVLGLKVLPSARIGLAGAYSMSNGHAVVDLGELRQGPAPVPLQVRVSSTGRYSLNVSSQNAGRLRLGATDWYVPYSLAIGSAAVNLSGMDTISGPTAASLTSDALPVHFVIGDVRERRAGTYSDVISISVTAQ